MGNGGTTPNAFPTTLYSYLPIPPAPVKVKVPRINIFLRGGAASLPSTTLGTGMRRSASAQEPRGQSPSEHRVLLTAGSCCAGPKRQRGFAGWRSRAGLFVCLVIPDRYLQRASGSFSGGRLGLGAYQWSRISSARPSSTSMTYRRSVIAAASGVRAAMSSRDRYSSENFLQPAISWRKPWASRS